VKLLETGEAVLVNAEVKPRRNNLEPFIARGSCFLEFDNHPFLGFGNQSFSGSTDDRILVRDQHT
jgi:hypothetical protein